MEFKLKYGHEKVKVDVPEKNLMAELLPEDVKALKDPEAEVIRALAEPIESKKLKDLVSDKDQVVILASDISRPSPSYLLLPPIVEELNSAGVKDKNIKIIFGLGVHRKQTEEEKKNLVGEEIYSRIECIDHDVESCRNVGTTERGTEIEIFDQVLDADFIIATGNLEYHYFAGFSGGAKALAPGVCSRKTILQNHQRFLDPLARGGQIEGNPVREEIEEIGELVGVDFMVNAVLNSSKKLIKVVAGEVTAAHRAGKEYIEDIYQSEIDELADIVITTPGGMPKDIDLYQTHKAMENASLAVKKGGKIIIAAKCEDGLGEDHFGEALTGGKTAQELIDELEHDFILGRHKASRIAMIHTESEISLVTSLSDDIKDKLFINIFDDLNSALKDALDELGDDAKILVIPYGISTLPKLKE
ncbi:MAG: nickel-dependent lactate racemase [Bacillota bacterium]